ncbi:MAG: pilus (MSHA type) biogenesis protein MshL [Immundisolibacteraceae bacterium]|nr:pilus (MSHA type) biogenesis protein MshL [Immundisolibacteraceae bacterium]
MSTQIRRFLKSASIKLLIMLPLTVASGCQLMPDSGVSSFNRRVAEIWPTAIQSDNTLDRQKSIASDSDSLADAETSDIEPTTQALGHATFKDQPQPTEHPVPVQQTAPHQELINISVHDMPARDFFLTLVDGSSRNLVVHPLVEGNVTLSLNQVTLEQVLQTVRQVYGYEFRKTANIIQVLPARMATKIFTIDYLNVTRSGNSQTRVSSGQLTESISSSSSSDDSDDPGSEVNSQSTDEVSGSQVTTTSYTNFWSVLERTLSLIVGSEQGRKVVINPDVGVAVISAMPGELRQVENYLNTIQEIAQRQVILEAKIIEVELSNGFRSGINWSALLELGSNTVVIGQTGGGTLLGNGTGLSDISGNTGNLSPGNPVAVDGTATSAFGGALTAALNLGDFQAFIELLQLQGEVRVLSSPRIATINNQKAVIKVGTDEFFVTDVSTDTTNSNGGSNQTVEVELTPFFSGVALDVIPLIDADGTVVLHIHPTVSEVTEKIKQIDVSSNSQLSVPLALSNVRESDTIVRARSGEVIVIGGLMSSLQKNIEAGTPGLSDLPWIGKFFKHQSRAFQRSELVILLRPMIADQRDMSSNDDQFQGWNNSWSQTGELLSNSMMGRL